MNWRIPGPAPRFLRTVVAVAIFFAHGAASAAAGTVTLMWDPNPEPDISGYVVLYGTSPGQYVATVDVGNQTSFQFVEPDPAVPYYFAVSAYNGSGIRSELSTEVSTTPGATLSLTGLTSNLPAPQSVGTSVTFTATTTGDISPQYKWLIFDGSVWNTAQNWSNSNTFAWTPAIANANYRVGVWARGATSTLDAPDPSTSGYISFPIASALAVTALGASLSSPQPLGTSITFTVSATGGVAPYQYKWLISDGASWSVAQQWSSSNTFIWTPSVAKANYSIGVWVRSATSTVDGPESSNAGSSLAFAITANTKIALTGVSANKPAPQAVGSKILFTASAGGASAYEFKWWVFDGVTWSITQEWSSSNRFMWVPAAASPNYQVLARVRDASNPSESDGAAIPFVIEASGGKGNRNR